MRKAITDRMNEIKPCQTIARPTRLDRCRGRSTWIPVKLVRLVSSVRSADQHKKPSGLLELEASAFNRGCCRSTADDVAGGVQVAVINCVFERGRTEDPLDLGVGSHVLDRGE